MLEPYVEWERWREELTDRIQRYGIDIPCIDCLDPRSCVDDGCPDADLRLREALEAVMPESHHPTCAVYLPQEECDCGYDLAEAALARIPVSKESPATRKSA